MLFLCDFPDVDEWCINYRLVNIFSLVSYRIECVDNLCYSDSVSQELGFLKGMTKQAERRQNLFIPMILS